MKLIYSTDFGLKEEEDRIEKSVFAFGGKGK